MSRRFYTTKLEMVLLVEVDDSRPGITDTGVASVIESHIKSVVKAYGDTGNSVKINRADVEFCRADEI